MPQRQHRITLTLAVLAAAHTAHAQESAHFPRQDKARVPAMVYAPAGPACRGVAVISPGAGGSEQGSRYLGEAVSALGYLGVVVGHAESGRRALREHTRQAGLREGLAELITEPEAHRGRLMDVAAARRWAQQRCPAREAVLIGHSMGAATAMIEAGARNKVGAEGADGFNAYVALSPQGAGSIFLENAWSGIQKPVLMLTGTRDTELGGASWESRTEAFKNMPSGCKWLGVIDGATHMNFAGNGAARKTEALTAHTIGAFLQGVQLGACRTPPPADGLQLSTR